MSKKIWLSFLICKKKQVILLPPRTNNKGGKLVGNEANSV